MEEVLFYKGLKAKYNKALYGNGIYFATDTKEIIVDGVSYGSVDIDDELTEISNNPVKGSAIYKAIKDNINKAIDTAPYGASLELSASNNTYTIILRGKDGTKLSEIGPIVGEQSDAVDISGLRVARVGNQHLQVKTNQSALLGFSYDVWDSAGQSLGTSGKAYLYDSEDMSNILEEKTISVGEHSFDVTAYLKEGELHNFYIKVIANTPKGEESYSLWYTARLVNIAISSTYSVNTITKIGEDIQIPFSIVGINGLKVVRAYLNGVETNEPVEVSTTTSSSSIKVSTVGLSHGTHNIQLRADYEIEGTNTKVYSNIIYLDVIVIEEGNNTPVFACRFDYENGDNLISGTPIVNASQYDLFTLNYFVYDNNILREVEFYSEGESVGSNAFSDAASIIKYRYTKSGAKQCYFEYNGYTYPFVVNVTKSNYQISEPTSSLSLYLDALGKSNTSSSKDSWTYNEVTSNFEGFNWSGNGWTGNSLKLFNGAKVTINHQPFKPATSGALAFTIRMKVTNVSNPDEVLVSCVDNYGNGLTITAQEAKLKTQSSEISTKFASGQIYNIGFVSFPQAGENSNQDGINNNKMCYVYVDGVISGGVQKTLANDIYQIIPQNITIQASTCELEVYSIRSYNTELNDDEMFNCFLIDLVDSEAIAKKYENNDILNLQGEITVDKIHGKIPYFIITGPSVIEGRSQFEHVAIVNDKDPKYDVDSILYVDTDPEFNFYCIPGKKNPQIRLQGTSSMAYPRKNYRIYTKDATLYVGCDKNGEGGKLQDKPKYSMSATAAPVNCFCLKADAAESSSSHNTGTTGLVEEVLNKINFLTPAQKYVDKEQYPYQVRTTVEGHPCLMFYRNSVEDTPKFGGKYNFNNDKSTEDVFGFLDIPGYNDNEEFISELEQAALKSLIFPEEFTETSYDDEGETIVVTKEEIIEMIGKNPTECWEFSNNSTRMGNFLEADFDKIDPDSSEGELYWMTSWEARFPDEDGLNAAFKDGVKPYYLMNLAKWIVSTNVEQATGLALDAPVTYGGTQYSYDTAAYRQAKFKAELSNYFDVSYLCSYYIFTDCLAAADQRVKNMMWGFWYNPTAAEHEIMGKVRCYPIFYDNDTILGLDNTGKIALNWDVDENTMNGEAPAFAGHDSTIWINLRSQFAEELKNTYVTMADGSNFVDATMLKWYNTNQSDKYCERVYNKDALYKYIIPFNVGVDVMEDGVLTHKPYDYLNQMHGSRRAHRSWFIDNRMDLFNARYQGGSFKESEISWKGAITPAEGESISLTLETSRDYYVAIHSDMTGQLTHQMVVPGEPLTVTLNADKVDIGAIYHIYGIRWLKSLDVSNWGGFENFNATDVMPALETLILGGHRGTAESFGTKIFEYTPALKYLDMTNVKLTAVDLTKCPYLETLIATGTKLTTAVFAEGSNLELLLLPTTFTNLSLIGLPRLNNSGISFENSDNLLRLRIEKCANINGLELLNNILSSDTNNLKYIRVTDLNIEGNGQDLIRYKNLGLQGIDSEGNVVLEKCKLVGTYKLTTLLDELVYKELCEYFDELNIIQPEYTTISFDLSNSTSEKVTNYDNNTGIAFGNTYVPSGHITRILNKRHSYLVKNQGGGVFAAMQLSDTNSNIYFEDETTALLNGTEGDYCMYEPHYWYKGINDHMNRKMYVLFSSNEECPKQAVGLKITLADCTSHKNKRVNASTSSSEANVLVDNTVANISAYSYTIPQDKQYKQIRVSSIANPSTGCVIVDSEGNILSRLYADSSKGMHNASYLFGNLPEKAYKVYFTIDTDYPQDYYIYLTESTDLEAIEPDWVEHKECFVGRVMSTLYNGDVKSAIYPDIINSQYGKGYYPMDAHGTAVTSICSELSGKAKGYYAADYEVLKDIIILAYAKYGGTGLHSNYVGAGANESGEFNRASRYFFNAVYYTDYGVMDTSTSGAYDSYYPGSIENKYPMVPTLLGYHQFIGRGTTTSVNDIVSIVSKTYSNSRTSRSVKLQSIDTTKYSTYITGGRYVDLFPAKEDTGGTSTAGFCGRWTESSLSSGSAFIEFGHNSGSTIPVSYDISLASSSVTQTVTANSLKNLQRVLIVPDQINIFTDSNLFKQV